MHTAFLIALCFFFPDLLIGVLDALGHLPLHQLQMLAWNLELFEELGGSMQLLNLPSRAPNPRDGARDAR